MQPYAIEIAKSRLRVARRAVEALSQSKSAEQFMDQWFVFLTAWKGIYTTLEQGSKNSPQSRQWFGAKKTERKRTQLLQYLFEARNDEEHGLARSITPDGHKQLWRFERPALGTEQITMRTNPATGVPEPWCPENPMTLVQATEGPTLVAVKDRGGRVWRPPIGLPGREVDVTPIGIADAALDYAAAMVDEASSLHSALP